MQATDQKLISMYNFIDNYQAAIVEAIDLIVRETLLIMYAKVLENIRVVQELSNYRLLS